MIWFNTDFADPKGIILYTQFTWLFFDYRTAVNNDINEWKKVIV